MAHNTPLLEAKQHIENGQPFCIMAQSIDGAQAITVSWGTIEHHHYLSDMPTAPIHSDHCTEALASINLVPYCQIKERTMKVADGGEPIISLVPTNTVRCPTADFYQTFDYEEDLSVEGELTYNFDDADYEAMVAAVIRDEIKNGAGSNFLLSRKTFGQLNQATPASAITLLKRLIRNEFGAYITFCFYDGENTFIGASPERHLTIRDTVATMNPISGTLAKMSHPDLRAGLVDFVQDEKEINELFMVVDETMKMMIPLCPDGGTVHGPFLKEMSQVVHTENVLTGRTLTDRVDAFRATMYAPTMVGSPLESAARVIYRYEKKQSRGYYTGALLILGEDAQHQPFLDSAITIRTVHVKPDGQFVLQSGGSIVRDSCPIKEAIEVRSKALGMLKAITSNQPAEPTLSQALTPDIEQRMRARNERLSPFWVKQKSATTHTADVSFKGRSIFIINNEDDFVYMLAYILQSAGASVNVQHIRTLGSVSNIPPCDVVVIGPGPGDPNELNDPKIAKLEHLIRDLMNDPDRNVFGVCLGHQMLCRHLGINVRKLPEPTQGVQLTVPHFGENVQLGFYNTFAGHCEGDAVHTNYELSKDDRGFVYAIRGNGFGSIQAHAESVISRDGPRVIYQEFARLLNS